MCAGAGEATDCSWRSAARLSWALWPPVLGAAWIADLGAQPPLGMLHQFQCAQACFTGLGPGGLIAAQQLHQGGGKLFGGPSGALAFEGMPVAFPDAQLTLQLHSALVRPFGPVLVPVVGPVAHAGAGVRFRGHPDGRRPLL